MDQNTDNPNINPDIPPQTPPPGAGAEIPPQTPPPGSVWPQTPSPVLELNPQAKQWGMFCHLAALAGFTGIPFANVFGPLIIWLIKKDEFAFVNDQGKEALNFQISVAIYMLVSAILICLGGLGFILMGAIAIADLVFIIIASIESNKGKAYRYPATIRLIK